MPSGEDYEEGEIDEDVSQPRLPPSRPPPPPPPPPLPMLDIRGAANRSSLAKEDVFLPPTHAPPRSKPPPSYAPQQQPRAPSLNSMFPDVQPLKHIPKHFSKPAPSSSHVAPPPPRAPPASFERPPLPPSSARPVPTPPSASRPLPPILPPGECARPLQPRVNRNHHYSLDTSSSYGHHSQGPSSSSSSSLLNRMGPGPDLPRRPDPPRDFEEDQHRRRDDCQNGEGGWERRGFSGRARDGQPHGTREWDKRNQDPSSPRPREGEGRHSVGSNGSRDDGGDRKQWTPLRDEDVDNDRESDPRNGPGGADRYSAPSGPRGGNYRDRPDDRRSPDLRGRSYSNDDCRDGYDSRSSHGGPQFSYRPPDNRWPGDSEDGHRSPHRDKRGHDDGRDLSRLDRGDRNDRDEHSSSRRDDEYAREDRERKPKSGSKRKEKETEEERRERKLSESSSKHRHKSRRHRDKEDHESGSHRDKKRRTENPERSDDEKAHRKEKSSRKRSSSLSRNHSSSSKRDSDRLGERAHSRSPSLGRDRARRESSLSSPRSPSGLPGPSRDRRRVSYSPEHPGSNGYSLRRSSAHERSPSFNRSSTTVNSPTFSSAYPAEVIAALPPPPTQSPPPPPPPEDAPPPPPTAPPPSLPREDASRPSSPPVRPRQEHNLVSPTSQSISIKVPAPSQPPPPPPMPKPSRGRPSEVAKVVKSAGGVSPASSRAGTPRQYIRTREQELEAFDAEFEGTSDPSQYPIAKKLGEGTFGEVHKSTSTKTGAVVALKRILVHSETDGVPITTLREIKLLKALSHPNVVPVIDMILERGDETSHHRGKIYMVFPFADHDLSGLLENPEVNWDHRLIKLYAQQLLRGTHYLHQNNILHRDMKTANLLINNQGLLQIADFGLARTFTAGGSRGGSTIIGGPEYTNMVVTRWYRPPELLLGLKKYGPSIDMWGVGCVIAEMFCKGKPILQGNSDQEQLALIWNMCGTPTETNFPGWNTWGGCEGFYKQPGEFPRQVKEKFVDNGSVFADMLDGLLTLNPAKRTSAREALQHPWFWAKPLAMKAEELPHNWTSSHEYTRKKKPVALPPPPPAPPAFPNHPPPAFLGRPSNGLYGQPPQQHPQVAWNGQQQQPGFVNKNNVPPYGRPPPFASYGQGSNVPGINPYGGGMMQQPYGQQNHQAFQPQQQQQPFPIQQRFPQQQQQPNNPLYRPGFAQTSRGPSAPNPYGNGPPRPPPSRAPPFRASTMTMASRSAPPGMSFKAGGSGAPIGPRAGLPARLGGRDDPSGRSARPPVVRVGGGAGGEGEEGDRAKEVVMNYE